MKFFLSIFFLLTYQCSYSQITQISPNKNYKVGEVEKCSVDENDKKKCEWIARFSYGISDNQRIYTLKYQAQYGAFGSKPKKVVREIKFVATESEMDFLYNQIEEWKSDILKDKPEKIKFNLGNHVLEVSERRDGMIHELYFVFEKTEEERAENFSINGILFFARDLNKLFGKAE